MPQETLVNQKMRLYYFATIMNFCLSLALLFLKTIHVGIVVIPIAIRIRPDKYYWHSVAEIWSTNNALAV